MTDLLGGGAEKALIDLLKNFDYTRYRVTLCLAFNRGVYLEDIPKVIEVILLFERAGSEPYRSAGCSAQYVIKEESSGKHFVDTL